jgi:hypothetical protein
VGGREEKKGIIYQHVAINYVLSAKLVNNVRKLITVS